MNPIMFPIFAKYGPKRLFVLAALVAVVGLVVPGALTAGPIPLYQNSSDSQYFSPPTSFNPPNSPPQIDATAFDNESLFALTFNSFSDINVLYEPTDTYNYTNGDNGLLTVSSLGFTLNVAGNFAFIFNGGAGLQFDLKTARGHQMAQTFYNSGTIRCDSILDGNDTYGSCIINATNIYNPGDIVMGLGSLLQINGQTVDLNRSVLDLETLADQYQVLDPGVTVYNNVNLSAVGAAGVNTNTPWDPSINLGQNFALSSYPFYLFLTNSISYLKIDQTSSSNVIVRAVFVQNSNPNVTNHVYIQPANQNDTFGAIGSATVEWVGPYTDVATGNSLTNYFYLNCDYIRGASTNVAVVNGVPDNFRFLTTTTPQLTGYLDSQYLQFPSGAITNPYAYFTGAISPSTVITNASNANPSGSITNIDGRIQITAARELDLNNAIISGQNYLSIVATNQFDGSAGSFISAPYSDINLGVTNGAMSVTNLLISQIPSWSGAISAWSTRWTNTYGGINYDFRVELVASQLVPTTQPWVQNLQLHTGTNLVVSDVLNIYGNFLTDAANLTVTTNSIGVGATSLEGQLNSLFGGNLGPAQWPNLHNFTNNGTVSAQNQILLTNTPATRFGGVVNNGFIFDEGTVVYATNFINTGVISNGVGGLAVAAQTCFMTNATVLAGGVVNITSSSLVASNVSLQCLSLVLYPTNSLTDWFTNSPWVTNANFWTVGRTNGTGGSGFSLLNNPGNGDLLGTTITNICPPANKQVVDSWAGHDFGLINLGFTNNAAVGHLVLDVRGNTSLITIKGSGTSNAIYVDCLEFKNVLTNGLYNNFDFSQWLSINTNLTIYFSQALINGISVAEKIDTASVHSGRNGGRLRWIPTFTGDFSSTNFVVNGVTNSFNAALAESTDIDSNGNGVANAFDANPFTPVPLSAAQVKFSLVESNLPPKAAVLTWNTIPVASNFVYYSSSLTSTNWQLFTSFQSTGISGTYYPVSVTDTNITKGIRFYKVLVQPEVLY